MSRPPELQSARGLFRALRGMLVLAVLTGAVIACSADAPDAQAADYEDLRARLVRALSAEGGPDVVIASIKPAPATGLLEVALENGPVLYATPDGDFFVLGDLFAVEDGDIVNLAEQKREQQRLERIAAVASEDMIVFSPNGEVRDYITVFTDTTCGYCRKLHSEVPDLNKRGIEVRYLAYPRAGLTSKGAQQLATAWCSDNPAETLTKFKSGVELPINACSDAPIREQFQLGQALGVRGTPAIITSSGRMVPGYRPAADIERMLGLN